MSFQQYSEKYLILHATDWIHFYIKSFSCYDPSVNLLRLELTVEKVIFLKLYMHSHVLLV